MRLLTLSILLSATSLTQAAVDSSAKVSEIEMGDKGYCKIPYTADGETGTYLGQCLNNLPHGDGAVSFRDGSVLKGSFTAGVLNGDGELKSSDGSIYKGDWQDGKRHGQGTYTWAQGSSYTGEWVDDKRHGKGTFVWSNGSRFVGEFRDNKRYNGRYFTSSGRVYRCRLGQCK